MRSCEKQIIYLISCSLNDTVPEAAVIDDID